MLNIASVNMPKIKPETKVLIIKNLKSKFSDELSVKLHPKRRQYCRRPSGARLDPQFTQKTVKFGGGKIMLWGYTQYGGPR